MTSTLVVIHTKDLDKSRITTKNEMKTSKKFKLHFSFYDVDDMIRQINQRVIMILSLISNHMSQSNRNYFYDYFGLTD